MIAQHRTTGRSNSSLRLMALLGTSVLALLAWALLEPSHDDVARAQAGPIPIAQVTGHAPPSGAAGRAVTEDSSGMTPWETPLSGPGVNDTAPLAKQGSQKKKAGKPKAMVGGKPKLTALSKPTGQGGAAKSRVGGGRKAPGMGLVGSPGFKTPTDDGLSFQFKTRVDTPFSLAVVTPNGLPLSLARVSVVAALAPPPPGTPIEELTSPDGWFDGFSDGLGHVQATLSLPTAVATVDVVVSVAGHTGEYTHEALRALWGPFAPASRLTVPVDQLTNLTVELVLQ